MNLQARNVSARRPVRKRTSSGIAWTTKLYIFCYLLAMAAAIFGIATYRIRLSRQISDLQRAAHLATKECANLDLDIQSLKLQRDELTGAEHIRRQIAAYKLPLRAPEPAQIRHIAVRYRRTNGEAAPLVASERSRTAPPESQLTKARP